MNTESGLRPAIESKMREKDTEELLEIWQTNDRREWTAETFDIIHQILIERLGSVPEQEEEVDDEESNILLDLDLLASHSNTLSTLSLILGVIFLGVALAILIISLLDSSLTNNAINLLTIIGGVILLGFLPALICGFITIALKALNLVIQYFINQKTRET